MKKKSMISRGALEEILVFSTLFVVCLYLAAQLNFIGGKPRGAGVFASDKSIYYVYLPATFIYGWDVNKFPRHCDTIYKGFILDYKTGKIVNKMTCGVALLWTPFFLVTHAIATVFNLHPDGFSDFYQEMALIPPVFFLVLGLFFTKRFLRYYFPPPVVYTCLLFLLAGTNLFYYGLVEGLMSHVHSFFLFALYLYLLKKFHGDPGRSLKLFAAISATVALAILVRPTNLVILAWFFLLDAANLQEIAKRIRIFFRTEYLLTFALIVFLVFLPQLIYWKYVSGSFLHYSYGKEGFFYWKNPVILPLLFSPFNGLFLYNPMVLLFVAGASWMIFRRKANGLVLLFTFALVAWISGSWHMWFFGGSFGSRPFVEYDAILSLGFGFFLAETARLKNLFTRSLVLLCMIIFSYYNLKLVYHNSWYTGSVWDWDAYKNRLEDASILHFSKDSYTYINDFENISFEPAIVISNVWYHSRNISGLVDSRYEYCGVYRRGMNAILDHPAGHITAGLWVSPVGSDSTDVVLVASIEDEQHHPWFYRIMPVNRSGTKTGTWSEVRLSFAIPHWLSEPEYTLKIYLWNVHHHTFYLDDVRVKIE